MVEKNMILVISTLFLISSVTSHSQCVQTSPCSCILPDGSGYDFSVLGQQSPLNLTSDSTKIHYWFQPCKDVPFTSKSNNTEVDGCDKPVSLCTLNETSSSSRNDPQNRGSISEARLELGSNDHILMIVYKHNNYTTTINLICCKDCESKLAFDPFFIPTSSFSAALLLRSPEVCKHQREGISGGSVFLILLLVFAGVYFVGGALALKFLRGATGWEMLPNHKFWCALGRQIKIGFVFLFSGCKEDSYERI